MKTWDEYAAGWRDLHGGYDPRAGSAFVRGWLRLAYLGGRSAARLGASPSAVTAVGLGLSLCVPVVVWLVPGGALVAAVLVMLSAVADTVDGAVAVIAGRASRLGYVYDSLADRLSEAAWLVALWLAGGPVWLLLVAGGVSWLHEYLRARAAMAGLDRVGVVTVAERPTRIIVVVAGLLASGAVGGVGATAAAGLWVVLALVGFGQLFVAVRRALSSSI